MPDLTITTQQLSQLQPTLAAISGLTPPPTPKGRYVLSKAQEKAAAEYTTYQKSLMDFIKTMVTQDEAGEPILEDAGNGQVRFTIRPDKQDEYAAGTKGLAEESVTLIGVRQITHAELGACPITIEMERALIVCGLLEDVEPT